MDVVTTADNDDVAVADDDDSECWGIGGGKNNPLLRLWPALIPNGLCIAG